MKRGYFLGTVKKASEKVCLVTDLPSNPFGCQWFDTPYVICGPTRCPIFAWPMGTWWCQVRIAWYSLPSSKPGYLIFYSAGFCSHFKRYLLTNFIS
jgi:hypothetical protein